ncbi:28S ribosomal protein S36, mitochondrial-like [Lingula anatina]|uniref:28S ribosomal protein S36, mitochondrial-like n=1 Tax=Lingula anatina TaxID=7574 RepID=A0A1S3K4J7_LINAN|nr:28S ribosomal protein S36, mitochondrial-like [Lingula anatina]|eukprot:XP_013417555.1 28S ribosomal protein S36, mitochondrial-like [Lingula anatina]
MAAAGRGFQAVKQHIPLIKFPQFNIKDPKGIGMKLLFPPSSSKTLQTTPEPAISQEPEKSSPPIGYIPRGSGVDPSELLPKYHRKPIDIEEMEYITRGGPE